MLLFLASLLLLIFGQSQKVHSRKGEPQSCISGRGQKQKRASGNQKLSERLQREGNLREFTTKRHTNIWAHLRAVYCVSHPKQHANSFEICTLEKIMDYTHRRNSNDTKKALKTELMLETQPMKSRSKPATDQLSAYKRKNKQSP